MNEDEIIFKHEKVRLNRELLPEKLRKLKETSQEKSYKHIKEKILNSTLEEINSDHVNNLYILTIYLYEKTYMHKKKDLERYLEILYYLISKNYMNRHVEEAIEVFIGIIDLRENFFDIELDSDLLYNCLYELLLSNSKLLFELRQKDNIIHAYGKFALVCSNFFKRGSNKKLIDKLKSIQKEYKAYLELLNLVLLMLNPKSDDYKCFLEYSMEIFASTNSKNSLTSLLILYSRLSLYHQEIDWSPFIPILSNKLILILSSNEQDDDDSESFNSIYQVYSTIFLNLFFTSSKELAKRHLKSIFSYIKKGNSPIQRSKNHNLLLKSFIMRINTLYKHYRLGYFKTKLSDEDVNWVIDLIFPIYKMDLFKKNSVVTQLFLFAQLRPEKVIVESVKIAENLISYSHLRIQAVSILNCVFPIISLTDICKESAIKLAKKFSKFVNQIDEELSISIIIFFSSLITIYPPEVHFGQKFIVKLFKRVANFSKFYGSSGSDGLRHISFFIRSLVHGVSDDTRKKLEDCIFESFHVLSKASLSVLSKSIIVDRVLELLRKCNEENLHALSGSIYNPSVIEKYRKEFEKYITDNINHENEDVRCKVHDFASKFIHNSISTFPELEKGVFGYRFMDKSIIKWYYPSQETIDSTKAFIEKLIDISNKYLESDWYKMKTGISIIRAVLIGLSQSIEIKHPTAGVEAIYEGIPVFTEIFNKLIRKLDSLVENEQHNQVLISVLGCYKVALFSPIFDIDPKNTFLPYNEIDTRLYILGDNRFLPNHIYARTFGQVIFTLFHIATSSTEQKMHALKQIEKICCTTHSDVKNSLKNIFQSEFDVVDYDFSIVIKGLQSDNEDIVSSCSRFFSFIVNNNRVCKNYKAEFDVIQEYCKPLPINVDDSVNNFRSDLSGRIFEHLTERAIPYDKDYRKIKKEFLENIFHKACANQDNPEIEDLCFELIFTTIDKDVSLLSPEIFSYLLNGLLLEHEHVLVIEFITRIFEVLIPRVPYIAGNSTDIKDFDNFPFYNNNRIKKVPTKRSIMLSKEEALSVEHQSKYFSDPEHRVQLFTVLYDFMVEDNVQEIYDLMIDNKDNLDELNESPDYVGFWTSVIRLMGFTITPILLRIAELTDYNDRSSVVLSTWDLLCSVLFATKYYSYKYVEMFKDDLFKYLHIISISSDKICLSSLIKEVISDNDPRRYYFLTEFSDILFNSKALTVSKTVTLKFSALFIQQLLYEPDQTSMKKYKELYNIDFIYLQSSRKYVSSLFVTYIKKLCQRKYYEEIRGFFEDYLFRSEPELISLFINLLYYHFCTRDYLFIHTYLVDNIDKIVNLTSEKDDEVDNDCLQSLLNISQAQGFINVNEAGEILSKLIAKLTIENKPWKFQVKILQALTSIVTHHFFFLSEENLDNIIKTVDISLSSNVQQVYEMGQRLLIKVINLTNTQEKYTKKYIDMMNNKTQKLTSLNGLCSIIYSEVIFFDIPYFVLDSLNCVRKIAYANDSNSFNARVFLSNFLNYYETNLLPDVMEKLSRFRDTYIPTYIT